MLKQRVKPFQQPLTKSHRVTLYVMVSNTQLLSQLFDIRSKSKQQSPFRLIAYDLRSFRHVLRHALATQPLNTHRIKIPKSTPSRAAQSNPNQQQSQYHYRNYLVTQLRFTLTSLFTSRPAQTEPHSLKPIRFAPNHFYTTPPLG